MKKTVDEIKREIKNAQMAYLQSMVMGLHDDIRKHRRELDALYDALEKAKS